MSTPYNPTGADDQNDKPDFTAERTPESGEPTTEISDSSSEWGSSSQSQTGQGGYTPYGEGQYGQGNYGQSSFGQAQYGQGEHQYGQAESNFGQAESQQPQAQGQYGQYGHHQQDYSQQQTQYGQGEQGGYQPHFGAGYPQGGYQQQYAPQGQFGAPAGNNRKRAGDGFINALFDFSFSRFITIDFAKVIYGISLGLIALFWLAGLIFAFAGFSEGAGEGFLSLFMYLIVGTLIAFAFTVLARISLEFYVAMVKTAQNTSKLVEIEEDKAGSNS